MSLVSSPSWGEDYDNLVSRDGIHYKKFTNTPFTGKAEGRGQGYIKNGKKEGPWFIYWPNGALMSEGIWVNGQLHGYFWSYWDNGTLMSQGQFIYGKREGHWLFYKDDGTRNEFSGIYKNGVKISD